MAESNLERAENRVREMREMTQNYLRQSNNILRNSAVTQNNNSPPLEMQSQAQNNNNGQNQNYNMNRQNSNQRNNMWNKTQNWGNMQNRGNANQPRFEKVNTPQNPQNQTQNPVNQPPPPPPPEPVPANAENKPFSNIIENLLGGLPFNLKIDDEKIIIIALIILLSREKADIKLIVALAYLIM